MSPYFWNGFGKRADSAVANSLARAFHKPPDEAPPPPPPPPPPPSNDSGSLASTITNQLNKMRGN